MPEKVPGKQLLHLVLGGELTELDGSEFKDLDKVEIVGVYPNYATAYAAWKAKAQQTVDNAHMRYFIVHLHRLLDPDSAGRGGALSRGPMPSLKRIARRPPSRRPSATVGACVSAAGLAHHTHGHRAGDDLRDGADAGHHRDVARPAFHGAVHQARRSKSSRQGADLAPPRRRDQCARRRAARHRHHPRLRRPQRRIRPQGRRRRLHRNARGARGRLQRRAHRRRAEGRARRRPRHRQAGAAFRAADLRGRDGDQHRDRAQQLGPHRDQPAVRPHRHGGGRPGHGAARRRRRDAGSVRGARSRSALNRVTARAYEIVDGDGSRRRERPDAGDACAPTGC